MSQIKAKVVEDKPSNEIFKKLPNYFERIESAVRHYYYYFEGITIDPS